ncbi:MAG: hypothetical protein ACJAS4_001152 [Bacteriovoracaceae bacterium]|jgi:fluoroquinolone resistance protein
MNYFEDTIYDFNNPVNLANIAGNEFTECHFIGLDLQESNFRNARFFECVFKECNLSNIIITGTNFRENTFSQCKMIGVNFSTASSFSDIEFKESILNYSSFQDITHGQSSKFLKCSLRETDFSQANFSKSDFSGSDLFGAIMNGTDLSGADLRSAINYSINPEFTNIKKARFSMPEVLKLLEHLEVKID